MKIKTTLAIVATALVLAACGKSEEAKPAPSQSRPMEDNIVVPTPDHGQNPVPKRGPRF